MHAASWTRFSVFPVVCTWSQIIIILLLLPPPPPPPSFTLQPWVGLGLFNNSIPFLSVLYLRPPTNNFHPP